MVSEPVFPEPGDPATTRHTPNFGALVSPWYPDHAMSRAICSRGHVGICIYRGKWWTRQGLNL